MGEVKKNTALINRTDYSCTLYAKQEMTQAAYFQDSVPCLAGNTI